MIILDNCICEIVFEKFIDTSMTLLKIQQVGQVDKWYV